MNSEQMAKIDDAINFLMSQKCEIGINKTSWKDPDIVFSFDCISDTSVDDIFKNKEKIIAAIPVYNIVYEIRLMYKPEFLEILPEIVKEGCRSSQIELKLDWSILSLSTMSEQAFRDMLASSSGNITYSFKLVNVNKNIAGHIRGILYAQKQR